ncbi:MAG TPA: BadF/BadG/BcrA/BcrD ATPase family protein, partial [Burkholderiales bacterium]|nr:BadF/BadG/BcrA/BcrD ATPase family protein [Burkholderiales bacterium]
MRFVLGLDVGGTKTHCLVAHEDGTIAGFGAAGCGSYEYHGVGPALAENRNAVDAALASAGATLKSLAGVGLGVAGADLPLDFEMLEREVYTPLFGRIPRAFKNDSFAALRGGTRDPYGIAIACGTDSVCAGISRSGDETRVGGFGPEFGNRCSGRLIGREGLMEVWRAREAIVPPTKMTDLVVARAGCRDADDLFDLFYTGRLQLADLEPMATLVFEAAVAGDHAARVILADGGAFLASMVNAVARRLGMTSDTFDVVMAGSVFRGEGDTLKAALRAGVAAQCPNARCALPVFEPVAGALFMGMDAAGWNSPKRLRAFE